MKIGIIGSGNVGGALGSRWAKAGHEVVFGTRDPQGKEMQQLAAKASGKATADFSPTLLGKARSYCSRRLGPQLNKSSPGLVI